MKNNKKINVIIVISTFNEDISNNLLEGASKRFIELGGNKKNLSIISVPGAFEIPGTIMQIIKQNTNYDAIITLGSIIKGETAHFEHIASSVTNSLSHLSMQNRKPIIYGILTTYNYQQALVRSNPKKRNKGREVMDAAFKIIETYNTIKK